METAVKVLVTGGSGRIGRYVVRELVEAGHEVTSVDVVPSVILPPAKPEA